MTPSVFSDREVHLHFSLVFLTAMSHLVCGPRKVVLLCHGILHRLSATVLILQTLQS